MFYLGFDRSRDHAIQSGAFLVYVPAFIDELNEYMKLEN